MTGTKCQGCGADQTNGLSLCGTCRPTLSMALTNAAAFYTDVLRIKPGQRVRVRSAYQSTPPPLTDVTFDPVTVATCHVDAIVVGWVRNLCDDRPMIGQPPADVVRAMTWLEAHISTIATLEWGGECLREMRECERVLQRLLDKSDTGWHAGVCGNEVGREDVDGESVELLCPRRLYGVQSTAWVRCPECGRTWDAKQRRDVMMAEARDVAAPVTVIARAVVGLLDTETSVERLANRIDQWVKRKRLRSMGVRVIDGRPLQTYRIGDVFDLLGADAAPKAG